MLCRGQRRRGRHRRSARLACRRAAGRSWRCPELDVAQIEQQLTLAVDRVMAEGSCYDRGLAALAMKQARGD